VTDFGDGRFVAFDVAGHDRVTVRADHLTWGTASVSGVFLDGGKVPPPPPPPPAPTLTITAVPPTGPAPLAVTFAATVTDAGTVAWDFRDGTGATGLTVTHTFASAGDYNVRATATGAGGTAVGTVGVAVTEPPPPPPPPPPPAPKTATITGGTLEILLPDGTKIRAVVGGT
jgi:PKD repeat protein